MNHELDKETTGSDFIIVHQCSGNKVEKEYRKKTEQNNLE